jgi:hypothetical protein
MIETLTLRELLTPSCPLGTDQDLVLEWVQDGTLYRVKEVLGYYLDIAPQLVNYRLVTTPVEDESGWERGWCYAGRGRAAFMAALLAAAMWDGSDDTEPLGWNRNLQTQQWREPGTGQTWQNTRAVPSMVGPADEEQAWPPKV